MGVTGGLVRSIFFRNKSFGVHEYNNGRSNLGEKKRWSSVRSYLCGDEFNSLLAVDDSGSLKDSDTLLTMSQQLTSDLVIPCDSAKKHLEDESVSEATVNQPLQEEKSKLVNSYVKEKLVNSYVKEHVDNQSEATETHIPKTPISKLFLEEDAAVIIQSAFRSYLSKDAKKKFVKEKGFSEEESPGKVSMGTSLQVQTPFYRRKREHKNKTQVLRIKEDWDDSTVSSTISKSRIQSRVEAMTKRERALAYAFSQQLRICSKKKQIDRSSEDESNIGWSWLERWMATRVPDSISIEPRTNSQTNVSTKNQRLVLKNIPFGIAGELESCASNDLPLQFESIPETVEEKTEDLQRKKSISKRKPAPSYKTQRRHNRIQATKRDVQQQTKKAKTTRSSCKMGQK